MIKPGRGPRQTTRRRISPITMKVAISPKITFGAICTIQLSCGRMRWVTVPPSNATETVTFE